jgi:hypothetical protein
MVYSLARGHAEPGHRDDLALHFVRAAAEREDRRVAAIEPLAAAVQHGARAAVADRAGGAEDSRSSL